MRKQMVLSVMVVLLLTLVAVGGAQSSRRAGGTINIGWVGDKTGPTASSQTPVLHALESYFKMTNDAGGINGNTINLIEKDDQFNVSNELSAVKTLITDSHVGLITGIGNSSGFASVVPVLTAARVPGLSNQGTLKTNTWPFQPWIYQGNCNYADQGDVALGYEMAHLGLKSLNGVKVGVVGISVASGQEWIDSLTAHIQKLGGSAVVEQLPPALISADVQVQDLQNAKVKFVLVHTATNGDIVFLNSMAKFSLDVPVAGSYAIGQSIVFTTAPYSVAKDVVAMNCVSPPNYAKATGGKLAVAMGKKYGYPAVETAQANWALGWVNAQIIVQALKNAHGDYTGPGIKKGLDRITNLDTGGLSPTITLSPKCHMAMREVRPYTYSYGKSDLVPVGSFEHWASFITNAQAAPGTCGRARG